MNLSVNISQRHAKMRAHTATHLLHAYIAKLFPQTQQAGSLVDNDYIRFDYTSDELLTPDMINQINKDINHIITSGWDVTTSEMNIEQALATGAKAFFQDKYGDTVRVVKVHGDDSLTSVELCGGTHVSNTREIGSFVIVEQSPVASGTKRIVAYTGPKTFEYHSLLESNLQSIASKLDCSTKQIEERLIKTLKDFEQMNADIQSLKSGLIHGILSSNLPVIGEYKVIVIAQHAAISSIKLIDIVTVAKTKNESVIIISPDGGYAIVGGTNAKEFAQSYGLKGGGSEGLFQGKDLKALELYK